MVPFSHWALTPLNWLSQALLYFQSVSPEYCAQYMLWALLQAESGATRRDNNGQVLGASPHYSGNEDVEKLWSHTEGEIEKALSVST